MSAGLSSVALGNVLDVSVDSQSGPWSQKLNPALAYGIGDNLGPTVISTGAVSGRTFKITYLGGLTNPFYEPPQYDASGDKQFLENNLGGSSGTGLPSRFVSSSQYPAYLAELIGAFAVDGVVVGTPFVIGTSGTFVAPTGVNELLLGINDDIFQDNTGSLSVQIDGPGVMIAGVPEPSTWIMILIGLASLVGLSQTQATARQTDHA